MPMNTLEWQNFLRSHPLFASLTEEEIGNLLSDTVAHERTYPQGAVILKEGEMGDSVFLIHSGSVQVALRGAGGPSTSLAVMNAGDIFGEMAVLERKPRSATVVAQENCLLLEIAGVHIRKLLEAHPQMQVKLYALAHERLKHWFHSLSARKS